MEALASGLAFAGRVGASAVVGQLMLSSVLGAGPQGRGCGGARARGVPKERERVGAHEVSQSPCLPAEGLEGYTPNWSVMLLF